MAKRRIQIEIDTDDSDILESLQKSTHSSITDVIKNALILYDWAVQESVEDRFVMSSTANIVQAAEFVNRLKAGEVVPEEIKGMTSSVQITKPLLKGVNSKAVRIIEKDT